MLFRSGIRRVVPSLARGIGTAVASRILRTAVRNLQFDILHVHAIHQNPYWNHQTLAELPADIPTVWTFHDFWGFSPESYRFQDLDGSWIRTKPDGTDREVAIRRRLDYFGTRLHLRLVGNSAATAHLAKEALKIDVKTIHCGLPLEQYMPLPRAAARLSLGIPLDAFVLGFSADTTSDPIKGFKVLEAALAQLDVTGVHALAVGSRAWKDYQIGSAQVRSLGRIDNPRLQAIVYSAANVFVVPSLAEALGQVAMESIACGTPVLAARTGGLVDVVVPDQTGWLFEVGNSSELHGLLQSIARNCSNTNRLHETCRRFAEDHWSLEEKAEEYLGLYRELLREARHV